MTTENILPKSAKRNWDDAQIEQLTRLWTSGRYSFTQIGIEMDMTRSQIAGMVRRLGITRPNKPPKAPRPARIAKPAANAIIAARLRAKKPPKAQPQPPVIEPVAIGKPWLDRRRGECAFPVSGHGDDVLSCCSPTGGATYCERHAKVMFLPIPRPLRVRVSA